MNKLSLSTKMVVTFLLLVTNFWSLSISAQDGNLLAQIGVYRAFVNGENMSQMSVDNNHCFQFYMQGGVLMFANNYAKLNSKSYGKITNVSYMRNVEKDNSFSDIYRFKWDWKNTFDNETGIADVYIKVITTNNATDIRVVVITGDLEEVLDYAGILMYGSLNSIR